MIKFRVRVSRVSSSQRVSGKLAISPDEGDLRLGRRLLALGNLGEARFDYVAVGKFLANTSSKNNFTYIIVEKVAIKCVDYGSRVIGAMN